MKKCPDSRTFSINFCLQRQIRGKKEAKKRLYRGIFLPPEAE
jgi:hypothetical protein